MGILSTGPSKDLSSWWQNDWSFFLSPPPYCRQQNQAGNQRKALTNHTLNRTSNHKPNPTNNSSKHSTHVPNIHRNSYETIFCTIFSTFRRHFHSPASWGSMIQERQHVTAAGTHWLSRHIATLADSNVSRTDHCSRLKSRRNVANTLVLHQCTICFYCN